MQERCHRHFHRELFSCAFSLLFSSTAARVVIKQTTPTNHVLIVRLAGKDCKVLRRRQEGGELDYKRLFRVLVGVSKESIIELTPWKIYQIRR